MSAALYVDEGAAFNQNARCLGVERPDISQLILIAEEYAGQNAEKYKSAASPALKSTRRRDCLAADVLYLSMQLRFTSSARRDLAVLPHSEASNILKAIEVYADRGVGDVTKLKGYKLPTWRLRVGSFRVLYRRAKGSTIIVTIMNRRDIYQR